MGKLIIKYSLSMNIFLIGMFLFFKLLNWEEYIELRFLNFFILIYHVNAVINDYESGQSRSDFLNNILIGTLTSFLSVLLFSFWFLLYLTWDINLLNVIIKQSLVTHKWMIPIGLIIEAMTSGIAASLWTSYRLWKQ